LWADALSLNEMGIFERPAAIKAINCAPRCPKYGHTPLVMYVCVSSIALWEREWMQKKETGLNSFSTQGVCSSQWAADKYYACLCGTVLPCDATHTQPAQSSKAAFVPITNPRLSKVNAKWQSAEAWYEAIHSNGMKPRGSPVICITFIRNYSSIFTRNRVANLFCQFAYKFQCSIFSISATIWPLVAQDIKRVCHFAECKMTFIYFQLPVKSASKILLASLNCIYRSAEMNWLAYTCAPCYQM
jgi:hypothetical protein